jgi:hypothetical protein
MHLSWEIPYRPIPDLTSRELAHGKYFQNFTKKVSTFEGVKHLYREGFLISEIFIPPPLKAGNEKAPPCGGAFSLSFFFRRVAVAKNDTYGAENTQPPEASDTFCLPAEIHGIIERKRLPTSSIW